MVKKMSLAALFAIMLVHVGQTEAKWLSKSFGGPISPVHSTLNDQIGRYKTNIDAFNRLVLSKAIEDAQSTKDKKELFLAFTASAGGLDSGKTILYMLAEKGNAEGIRIVVDYLNKNSDLFTPEELKGYTRFASLEEMAGATSPEQTRFDAPEGQNALHAAVQSPNPDATLDELIKSGWFTLEDATAQDTESKSAIDLAKTQALEDKLSNLPMGLPMFGGFWGKNN